MDGKLFITLILFEIASAPIIACIVAVASRSYLREKGKMTGELFSFLGKQLEKIAQNKKEENQNGSSGTSN